MKKETQISEETQAINLGFIVLVTLAFLGAILG